MNSNLEILWEHIREGDREAFAELFIVQYDDLFRYAKRFKYDDDSIADIIQDLFINIWQKHSKLGLTNNVKAYLYKSLRNTILNTKNNKHNRIHTEDINDNLFAFNNDDFADDNEFEDKRKAELVKVINALPKKQREVIYLKYFQGFDTEEIAQILNQNNQSVRNNLHRAIASLRKNMVFDVFVASVTGGLVTI